MQVLVLSNITAASLSMAIGAAVPSVALANMVRAPHLYRIFFTYHDHDVGCYIRPIALVNVARTAH
jgi:hypothetical protein